MERNGGISGHTYYPYYFEGFPFQGASRDVESGYFGLTKYDSAWVTGGRDTNISVQLFDDRDNILSSIGYKFVNNTWQKHTSKNYTYDVHNNLLTELDSSWLSYYNQIMPAPNIYYYQFTYDSQNNLVATSSQQWKENKWQNFSKRNIYSDSNIVVLVDTSWNFGILNSYGTKTITYKNSLPDSLIENIRGPVGIGHIVWTYYFSPAEDTMIVSKKGDYRIIHVYDTKHNKISTTTILDHPTVNMGNNRIEWSYNTYGQVTCQRNYSLDSMNNWVFNMLARFYYETYIPGPPYVENNLDIYPSPTKSELTMKLSWHEAQPFAICIYNSVGQRILQWDEPSMKAYKKTISLPDLASGNYFIQVNSGKQRIVKKFVIN